MRAAAALMALETASLVAVSAEHLARRETAVSSPFDPHAAGIAEAIIGVVLAVGTLVLVRSRTDEGRKTAMAATGFALVGFLFGLTFTLRGGQRGDVLYHLGLLPLLATTLWLQRAAPRTP